MSISIVFVFQIPSKSLDLESVLDRSDNERRRKKMRRGGGGEGDRGEGEELSTGRRREELHERPQEPGAALQRGQKVTIESKERRI